MAHRKAFIAVLFDVSFDGYITPKFIGALYRLVLGIAGNMTAAGILFIWWLPGWVGWGVKVLMDTGVIAAAVVWLSLARVCCEFLVVAFNIDANLSTLTTRHHRKDV